MNQAIQHLSEICEEYRFKEKILFVPSYSVGHHMGENLAREKGSWINLRVTTVAGFAQELIGPDLGKEGIRLIDSHENFLIIEEILRGDESLGGIGCYFEGAPDIPGIIRCLGNTIHELRMAGLEAADIDPNSFIVPQKGEEIQKLLGYYEAFLSENKLIDKARLITRAIRKMQGGEKPGGNRVVMVLSDFPLAEMEKQCIGLVGGDQLKVLQHSYPAALEAPVKFFKVPDKRHEYKSFNAASTKFGTFSGYLMTFELLISTIDTVAVTIEFVHTFDIGLADVLVPLRNKWKIYEQELEMQRLLQRQAAPFISNSAGGACDGRFNACLLP
ncbi:hypothetical protein ACFL0Q_01265 [Thermodesulfobacteriota bacterium]